MKKIQLVAVAAAAFALAVTAAEADVPTATDFAFCNAKATEQATGSASVAPGGKTVTQDPPGGAITGSNDAQLEGLAADRKDDPVYVQAYKSCMRQRGF
jgi:autotransporter adhesin